MILWAKYIPRRRNTSYFGEWPWGAGARRYVAAGLELSYENGKSAGHLIGAPAREVARRLKLRADDSVRINVKIEEIG